MSKFFLLALADAATLHDEDVRVLLRMARLLALAGRLAPESLGAAQSSALLTLASAVRVIHRVHGSTADRRALAHPAAAAGFPDDHEAMFVIRGFSDGCPGGADDAAHFGRRHLEVRVARILRDDLSIITSRTCDLAPAVRLHFDVVDERTDRHVLQGETVAAGDRGGLRDEERIPYY